MNIINIIAAAIIATSIIADVVTSQNSCSGGWFGLNCKYKCHCTDRKCDENGKCLSGYSCDKGWFGPDCQYVDLTVSGSVILKTKDGATKSDTLGTACLVNSNIQSVTVDLRTETHFTWMRLIFSDTDYTKKINVQFQKNDSPFNCTEQNNIVASTTALDIHCDLGITIKQVIVTGERITSLCSLHISGGRNIALKGNVTQSSTYNGNIADKAVDGDTSGKFEKTCSCTVALESNWTLTFSEPHQIGRFTLYNRASNPERLRGFIIKSYPPPIYTYEDKMEQQVVYNVTPDPLIKIVKQVQISTRVEYSALCEVEIYGDVNCEKGKHGRNCERFCKCALQGDACFVSTGGCPSGCPAGLFGNGCSASCPDRFYGIDCKNPCSQYCLNGACNRFNGTCNSCLPGKIGDFCEKACQPGLYGAGCMLTCSKNCSGDGSCDGQTGACNLCRDGYEGSSCNEICQPHYYGAGCKYSCSSNCTDQTCNHVSGECDSCFPGTYGSFCEKACEPKYYGAGCSNKCSDNCEGDGLCNRVNGSCNLGCKVGYEGSTCNNTCLTHYYGDGCQMLCSSNCTNQTCNHVSGNCHGCISGTFGEFCDQDYFTYQPGSEDSTPLIVGLIAGIVILILVLAIAAFIWRKRRNTKSNHQPQRQIIDDDAQAASTESDKTRIKQGEPMEVEKESENRDNEQYYNFIQAQPSTAIKVEDFHAFLLSHKAEFFKSQFQTIPTNSHEATTHVALSEKNKNKNRYKNICAYDHSRVCLTISTEKNEADYINASYIKGYQSREKFIASQGPNKVIINDFVRMLWEQKVDKVIMLTHLVEEGKPKCERYWPEDNKVMFGDVQVKLAATQVYADYTIRKLRLEKNDEPGHNFTHYHFTSWPDKDVPTTPWSLVDFEQRVFASPTTKPIVVHCSAGVGRTGTFIALHNVVQEAKDTGYLDFLNTLVKLRKDRMNMIQTAEQYFFLVKAAEVALLCSNTTISAHDINDRIQFLKTKESEMTNMEKEFNSICDVCAEDDKDDSQSGGNIYENSQTLVNKLKNRFSNILANDLYRPILSVAGNKTAGDYINAVLVPSFTKSNHQILTQLPLPTTITDFWRLVTQYEVSLIVAFELDMKATDLSIGNYLPSNEKETCKFDSFNIESKSAISGEFWMQQTLLITINTATNLNENADHKTEEHHLIHLKCTNTHLDPEKLLPLIEKICALSSSDKGRTLFICRNGATYSGLVYVLTLLLERINNDSQLTVPLVVGATKAIRPQVIPTVDHYRILYEVLNYYQDSTSVYSNLGESNLKSTTENKSKHSQCTSECERDMLTNENSVYANSMF